MSKTSEFLMEPSEMKRDSVQRLEVISLTSDIMSDSVCIEEATDKRYSGSASSENQGVSFPTQSMENNPKEKPAKGRKKKVVRSVFRSVWKAVKRPFLRCDPDRVVYLTPQPDQDDSDPRPIRNTPTDDKDLVDPEPVCLPGQVCEDVCVPGPSRTERTLDTDLTGPDSSPVADLGDEIPKRGNKRSRSHVFFKRAWKAIKKPFLSCRKSREESPAPRESDPEPAADPDLPDWRPNTKPLDELYDLQDWLGKGVSGEAFKAIRKSGGQQVAIKKMWEEINHNSLQIPGCSRPLPTEVGLLLTLRRPPECPYIIKMYEWSDHDSFWISLEFPQPCVTLREFIRKSSEGLTEPVARGLMGQLVLAVQHCIKRGVFHNDIHDANILVKTNTLELELKLIDFGFGHLLDSSGYESWKYEGAPLFRPPEAYTAPRFYAVPTNVWALGIVMYFMVNKELPFPAIKEIKKACPPARKAGVSDACYDLICKCLKRNPAMRPTLEQILKHKWFKLENQL